MGFCDGNFHRSAAIFLLLVFVNFPKLYYDPMGGGEKKNQEEGVRGQEVGRRREEKK